MRTHHLNLQGSPRLSHISRNICTRDRAEGTTPPQMYISGLIQKDDGKSPGNRGENQIIPGNLPTITQGRWTPGKSGVVTRYPRTGRLGALAQGDVISLARTCGDIPDIHDVTEGECREGGKQP